MVNAAADTQNQAWAADKSRFGFKMLEKMGWTEGKGLGVKEEGDTAHVKIKMKSNNLGIGGAVGQNDRWNTVANDYAATIAKLKASSSPGTKKKKSKGKKSKNDRQDVARGNRGKPTRKSPRLAATGDGDDVPLLSLDSKGKSISKKAKKEKKEKKRQRMVFDKRKRAVRNVNNYSAKDLAEIFGKAPQ